MKLDVDALRYLSKEDFRVLTAVEMGMRNHEIVPAELIDRIARLKRGGTYKVLKTLMKHKLLHHDSSKYDGYRLTYLGYDFLAINALVNRGVFSSVGRQIGVGKESDIFEVATEDGTIMAMKLHRLGRISFRAVKSKRDYLLHRRSYNWLYLSRLAALKEYAFMKVLCCLIDDDETVTMIDFPQMVSVSHRNAQMYFDRDIECIFKFFNKRFHIHFQEDKDGYDDLSSDAEDDGRPSFLSIEKSAGFLDRELAASGFTRKDQNEIEKFVGGDEQDNASSDDDSASEAQPEKDGTIAVVHTFQFLDVADQQDTRLSDNETDRHADPASKPHAVDIDVNVALPEKKREDGSDNSDDSEDGDPVLTRRLNKQRQRAMAAARGVRRAAASRNSYKDKGGKSSRNSKIQMQSSKW